MRAAGESVVVGGGEATAAADAADESQGGGAARNSMSSAGALEAWKEGALEEEEPGVLAGLSRTVTAFLV